MRQLEVDTDVLGLVQVILREGDTIERRDLAGVHTVGGDTALGTAEEVDGTAENATVDLEVDTEVHHAHAPPGKDGLRSFCIYIASEGHAVGEYIRAGLFIAKLPGIGASLLLTGHTVGPAEFEIVHPREDALEERLVGHAPTQGVCREEAPAGTRCIEVRTVVTAGYFGEILALIVIGDTTQITSRGAAATVAVTNTGGFNGLADDIVRVKAFILGAGIDVLTPVQTRFRGDHGGEVMLLPALVVVGLQFAVKALALVPVLRITVVTLVGDKQFVREIVVDIVNAVQVVGLALAHVVGSESIEDEALEERRLIFEVEAVVVAAALGLGITQQIYVKQGHRVPVLIARIGIVVGVSVNRRSHGAFGERHIVPEVRLCIGRGHTYTVVRVERRLIHRGQIIRDLGRDVTLEVEGLVTEARVVVDTLVLVVAGTQVVLGLLVAAAHGQGMVLLEGDFRHLVHPPRIHVAGIAVPEVLDQLVGILLRIVDIDIFFILIQKVVNDARFLRKCGRNTEGDGVRVAHRRLADRTFLRGHKDDTVLRTHTIQGRGGVLQDGDALDVFRVQLGKDGGGAVAVRTAAEATATTLGRTDHTVDDDDRFTIATDAEVGVEVTGATADLTDEQARNLTLQGCSHVRGLGCGKLLFTDVRNGCGQGSFLGRSVTDNHRFIEDGVFFREGDGQVRRGLDRDGLIADGRNLEVGTCGAGKGKVTVDVRCCTVRRADLDDGRTDDRLLAGIDNLTFHRNRLLRKQHRHAQQEAAQDRSEALEG